jgi:flagellar motility protein MotE (MotC chaperone)
MDGRPWRLRKRLTGRGIRPWLAVAAVVLAVDLAPRPGFGMDTIRGLVNRIRPGTFPELEAEREAKPQAAPEEKPEQRALTENERQILLSLMDRKRQLDERETALNQREEQLRQLRDNIQHQITELRKIQQEIESGMDAKKALDAENLNKVVGLYDGMDPKKSAQKFQSLDPKVAVQILMAMNQRKAAQLLEELPPAKAKEITEAIVRKAPPEAEMPR